MKPNCLGAPFLHIPTSWGGPPVFGSLFDANASQNAAIAARVVPFARPEFLSSKNLLTMFPPDPAATTRVERQF